MRIDPQFSITRGLDFRAHKEGQKRIKVAVFKRGAWTFNNGFVFSVAKE